MLHANFLVGHEVSETPDLKLITAQGETWWLDVVSDYPTQKGALSYWQKKQRCHLRDNKFKRLMEKRSEGGRVGLIGILVGTKSYFGLELTDELSNELEEPPKRNRRIYRVKTHWLYGVKPAIVLNLRLLGVQFFKFANFLEGLPFCK